MRCACASASSAAVDDETSDSCRRLSCTNCCRWAACVASNSAVHCVRQAKSRGHAHPMGQRGTWGRGCQHCSAGGPLQGGHRGEKQLLHVWCQFLFLFKCAARCWSWRGIWHGAGTKHKSHPGEHRNPKSLPCPNDVGHPPVHAYHCNGQTVKRLHTDQRHWHSTAPTANQRLSTRGWCLDKAKGDIHRG